MNYREVYISLRKRAANGPFTLNSQEQLINPNNDGVYYNLRGQVVVPTETEKQIRKLLPAKQKTQLDNFKRNLIKGKNTLTGLRVLAAYLAPVVPFISDFVGFPMKVGLLVYNKLGILPGSSGKWETMAQRGKQNPIDKLYSFVQEQAKKDPSNLTQRALNVGQAADLAVTGLSLKGLLQKGIITGKNIGAIIKSIANKNFTTPTASTLAQTVMGTSFNPLAFNKETWDMKSNGADNEDIE